MRVMVRGAARIETFLCSIQQAMVGSEPLPHAICLQISPPMRSLYNAGLESAQRRVHTQ